jgi:hypothetical protein
MHRKPSLLVAGVVATAALAGPAGALADGGGNIPFIQHQNAFGGNVENLAVGTPLQLNYLDPSGQDVGRPVLLEPGAARSPRLRLPRARGCGAAPSPPR